LRRLPIIDIDMDHRPFCDQPPHPVRLTTERRHGTYIYGAFDLHRGHTLTINTGIGSLNLFCQDCGRNVIEAGGNGHWRGEYEIERCRSVYR
jgi:hypothetical protein